MTQNRTPKIYGPVEQTLNQLRGIRYVGTDGDGTGAGGEDVVDDEKVEKPEDVKDDKTIEPKPDEKKGSQDDPDDKAEEKPPWGSDAEFTPDAAWKKIQAKEADYKRSQQNVSYLRDDNQRLESELAAVKAENEEFKQKASEESTKTTKRDLLTAAGLDPEDDDLLEELIGTDPEVWEKKIAKWVKLTGGNASQSAAPKGPNTARSPLPAGKASNDEELEKFRARQNRKF